MRSPTFKLNEWQISYRQIPYDNRYYYIKFNGVEICKIPGTIFDELQCTSFPLDLHRQIEGNEARFGRFVNRVEQYNNYLNGN